MTFYCLHCSKEIEVTETTAGTFGACPECGGKMPVSSTTRGHENIVTHRSAGFWRRTLASIIDGIVVSSVGFLISLVIMTHGGAVISRMITMIPSSLRHSCLSYFFLVLVIGFIGFAWLYSAFLESSRAQATLGKTLMRIKITTLYGRPVSFWRATGRFFGKFLSTAPLCAGFLIIPLTKRKQGLHDLVAGCLVVVAAGHLGQRSTNDGSKGEKHAGLVPVLVMIGILVAYFHYAPELSACIAFMRADRCQRMGRDKDALTLLLKAKTTFKEEIGDNFFYSRYVTRLARLYESLGRYSEALPLYLEGNAMLEKSLGKKNSNYSGRLT